MGHPTSDRATSIYRGLVASTADPLAQKRVKLKVPQVTGDLLTTWAEPVTVGAIPAVGKLVWVMFSNGEVDRPVYFPLGV